MPRLDELRDLARGGKEWIARYQAQEIERTGIPSLKVGFNKVFGYYLEVTARAAATRSRPTTSASRRSRTRNGSSRRGSRSTKKRSCGPKSRRIALEQELFAAAARARRRGSAAGCSRRPSVLAEVDVLAALATLAVTRNYCRPEIVDEPVLDIRDGRHPVLDRLQAVGRVRAQRRVCAAGAGTGRSRDEVQRVEFPSSPQSAVLAHHRPQHGRQEHLHPPGGAAHDPGPDGLVRPGAAAARSASPTASSPASAPATSWAAGRARSWSR